MKFPVLPDAASTTALHVDALYYSMVGLSVACIVVIFLPMFYFLFKYRRAKNVNRMMPRIPMLRIELTWTIIPLVLMMGVFVWATDIYFDIQRIPAGAME